MKLSNTVLQSLLALHCQAIVHRPRDASFAAPADLTFSTIKSSPNIRRGIADGTSVKISGAKSDATPQCLGYMTPRLNGNGPTLMEIRLPVMSNPRLVVYEVEQIIDEWCGFPSSEGYGDAPDMLICIKDKDQSSIRTILGESSDCEKDQFNKNITSAFMNDPNKQFFLQVKLQEGSKFTYTPDMCTQALRGALDNCPPWLDFKENLNGPATTKYPSSITVTDSDGNKGNFSISYTQPEV